MEYKGLPYLRKKLNLKREGVKTRYDYYEMKNLVRDFNISTPPDLKSWQSVLGWCGKSVDALADRIVVREFTGDDFNMQEIYDLNNPDILFDSAITGALISSCDFIYISSDENGFPRLQVIDGSNATGVIDPITNMLNEGYAVLERSTSGNPSIEAYFTKEYTEIIQKGVGVIQHTSNPAPYALLCPVIYKPDAKRPFGHARLTRAQMSLVGSALRTIKRSEIAAEFYSYPQKWVSGLSEDAEQMEKWKATMATILAFTKDENEDHPIVGQFQQSSMEPHVKQLEMFAALFAGETGLTLDDLGFSKANPSTADSIRASHENLRLAARKAQRNFSTGFINAGYLAACVRDNYPYERSKIVETKIRWYPIFEPDLNALGAAGDAIYKIQQAVPDFLTDEKIEDLLGL